MRKKTGPREAVAPAAQTIAFTTLSPQSSAVVVLHVARSDMRLIAIACVLAAPGSTTVPLTFKSAGSVSSGSPRTHLDSSFTSTAEPTVRFVDRDVCLVRQGDILWVEFGTLSGSPTQVHVTVEYETVC